MMASFLFFIFTILLFPVALSAVPTECYECFSDGGAYCTGKPSTCSHQRKCLAVFTVANLSTEYRFTSSFARSCVDSANYLEGIFHFNFGDDRILDSNSQFCNETKPECLTAPERDSMHIYENGKSCPKCYRTGYDNCKSNEDAFCLGDIMYCTEVNGEITSMHSGTTIPFAGKGCASQSVCNLGGKSVRHGSYTFKFKDVQCSKANGALSSLRHLAFTLEKKDLGPQVAFFFPCILGIFAVKILS